MGCGLLNAGWGLKQQVGTARCPAHRLTFVAALVDDLVDRQLHESRGDAFTGAKAARAIVHDVAQVVGDVRRELAEGGGKLLQRPARPRAPPPPGTTPPSRGTWTEAGCRECRLDQRVVCSVITGSVSRDWCAPQGGSMPAAPDQAQAEGGTGVDHRGRQEADREMKRRVAEQRRQCAGDARVDTALPPAAQPSAKSGPKCWRRSWR